MTCAPVEAAPLFVLDWWHMLKHGGTSAERTAPSVQARRPVTPPHGATMRSQTLNKHRAWLCLFPSFHCISICFFLSPTPSCCLLLSLLVTTPSLVLFIPPLPFSPNVPTEADLMDDPLLRRLGSPWGPLSLLCRNLRTVWQSKFRRSLASECKHVLGRYQGDLYRRVTGCISHVRSHSG